MQGTVSCWKKPIILGRHAYGDVYKNCEIKTSCAGKAELVFTGEDGTEIRKTIMDMKGPGILQGIHNLDNSIESFARCCFTYALDQKVSVWFGAKDTISKTYDGNFKAIFQEVYDKEFKAKFEEAGIEYFYTLIDDCVARIMKDEGGLMWACKNYDGDVMSDMVASACGSLAMMTSVLVSPDGKYEFEASHGTVQKHYYRYQKGERTSTNPVALIFAWTGALAKRAELDETPELLDFAKKLGLSVQQDEAFNVYIKKPASKGYEHLPTVILQGHLDMVCEKTKESNHNFDTDPIELIIDGDHIKGNNTVVGITDDYLTFSAHNAVHLVPVITFNLRHVDICMTYLSTFS